MALSASLCGTNHERFMVYIGRIRLVRGRVELKSTETQLDGGQWQWTATGKAANGRSHSLFSQCRASGADLLVLAWGKRSASRRFLVLPLRALKRPRQVQPLRNQHLERTAGALASVFKPWAVVRAAELRGAVAACLAELSP